MALVPWGATKGPAREAYDKLVEAGVDVGWYYTMLLNPMPPKMLEELRQKELVIVPELNYQGQFGSILRSLGVKAVSITQYTGLPFKVGDLVSRTSEMVNASSERDGKGMSKKNPEYDFKWCPGCGDFGVRRSLELAMIDHLEESGMPMENNVVVAGIGCSGNLVHLLEGHAALRVPRYPRAVIAHSPGCQDGAAGVERGSGGRRRRFPQHWRRAHRAAGIP